MNINWISNERVFKFFDKNISTKYCKIFDDLLWYKFVEIIWKMYRNKKYICPDPFIYAINYSPYYFILKTI